MTRRAALLLSALSLSSSTVAQSDLLAALNSAGVTSFSQALGSSSSLLSSLQSAGSGTIFAPSNAALSNVSSSTASAALPYHIARGSFPASSIPSTGDGIISTYLTDGTNLPGKQSQVLVVGKTSNGTVQIRQGLSNATVTASTTFQNYVIHTIDTALSVPADLATTATAAGLSSLAITLQQVLPGAIQALENVPGITVFAPINSVFSGLPGLLSSIPSGTVGNVLTNHVLNGSVVYTTSMVNGAEVVSDSGELLKFSTNSSGTYVSATNSTAQILIADVPISNGVVHVINGLLIDSNANSAQQAAAYSSAQANAPTSVLTGLLSQSLPTSISSVTPQATSTKSSASSLQAATSLAMALLGFCLLW